MRKIAVAAGVAAGIALISPAVASAGSPPVKPTLSVSVSGTSVTLNGTCLRENVKATGSYSVAPAATPAVRSGVMKADGLKRTITFKDVKPGKYVGSIVCEDGGYKQGVSADFTVDSVVKQTLWVSVSGTSATLHGTCAGNNVHAIGNYGVRNGHEPIGVGDMKADGHKQTLTFRNIKPGKYIGFMWCAGQEGPEATIADFTIGPKTAQVTKKPQGAPQTGDGSLS